MFWIFYIYFMKYMKYFKDFIKESLSDDIPGYMSDAIRKNNRNAEEILGMDVPEHNSLIPNTKILLDNSDEDISKIIDFITLGNKERLTEMIKNTDLYHILSENKLFFDTFKESLSVETNDIFDIFVSSYHKNFRIPTKDGYSKNKTSLVKFIELYNKIYPNVEYDMYKDKAYVGLRDPVLNSSDINYNPKLYLYISDKPDDILRMSVSNYYSSCMNLYNGSYNHRLVSNVFDPNMKVCYIISDESYIDRDGNRHEYSPICRCILRVQDGKILFDKIYPDKIKLFENMYSIITRYTGIVNRGKKNMYYDYKNIKNLPIPHPDHYIIRKTGITEEEIQDKIDTLKELVNSVNIVHSEGYYFTVDKKDEYVVLTEDEISIEVENYIRTDFWFIYADYLLSDMVDNKIINEKGLLKYISRDRFNDISVLEFFNDFETEINEKHFLGEYIHMSNAISYIGEEILRKKLYAMDNNEHILNGYYIYKID